MAGSNMPPGCSPSDIPGNSCEDVAWEAFSERMIMDCERRRLSISEARLVWKLGLSAWDAVRQHDELDRGDSDPVRALRPRTRKMDLDDENGSIQQSYISRWDEYVESLVEGLRGYFPTVREAIEEIVRVERETGFSKPGDGRIREAAQVILAETELPDDCAQKDFARQYL